MLNFESIILLTIIIIIRVRILLVLMIFIILLDFIQWVNIIHLLVCIFTFLVLLWFLKHKHRWQWLWEIFNKHLVKMIEVIVKFLRHPIFWLYLKIWNFLRLHLGLHWSFLICISNRHFSSSIVIWLRCLIILSLLSRWGLFYSASSLIILYLYIFFL